MEGRHALGGQPIPCLKNKNKKLQRIFKQTGSLCREARIGVTAHLCVCWILFKEEQQSSTRLSRSKGILSDSTVGHSNPVVIQSLVGAFSNWRIRNITLLCQITSKLLTIYYCCKFLTFFFLLQWTQENLFHFLKSPCLIRSKNLQEIKSHTFSSKIKIYN